MTSKVGENTHLELSLCLFVTKNKFYIIYLRMFSMCSFNTDTYSFYFGVEYFVFTLDNVLIGDFIFVVCHAYGIKSH